MLGLLGDKKKMMAAMVGEASPNPMAEEKPDGNSAKLAVAQDLLNALKNGDASGVSKALEDHYYLCNIGEEDELGG